MALIIEDGSEVPGADAYVTQLQTDTYWENRNDATWGDETDENKEASIRAATEYLDSTWVWKGGLTDRDTPQALAWPRTGAYDSKLDRLVASDEIPFALLIASYQLARDAIQNGNILLPVAERGNAIESTEEKVDVITTKVKYRSDAPARKPYALVSSIVSGLNTGRINAAPTELARG